MFSMKIVDSDAFLDMPQSSQLLYFHLAMRADDDGFVGNPKRIMRMIGAQDDDFKVLLGKRFVLPFQSGVCVIKHWKIHNYIQNDRYNETVYLEEKNGLKIKENGAYTECIQNVSNVDTQVRLGKVRLEQGKSKNTYGQFQNVQLTEVEYTDLCDALSPQVVDNLIMELDEYIASTGKKYKSHRATLQTWARRRIKEYKEKSIKKGKSIIGL